MSDHYCHLCCQAFRKGTGDRYAVDRYGNYCPHLDYREHYSVDDGIEWCSYTREEEFVATTVTAAQLNAERHLLSQLTAEQKQTLIQTLVAEGNDEAVSAAGPRLPVQVVLREVVDIDALSPDDARCRVRQTLSTDTEVLGVDLLQRPRRRFLIGTKRGKFRVHLQRTSTQLAAEISRQMAKVTYSWTCKEIAYRYMLQRTYPIPGAWFKPPDLHTAWSFRRDLDILEYILTNHQDRISNEDLKLTEDLDDDVVLKCQGESDNPDNVYFTTVQLNFSKLKSIATDILRSRSADK